MKRLIAVLFVFLCAAAFAGRPKYVFLFIGDGMSTPQRLAAEVFADKTGHAPVAMNKLPYQAETRTRNADSAITDSAAAATAIACGVKTCNGRLGIDAGGRRVESVAEMAKRLGMKVGIMTTVTIVHATPAAFYAHNQSRGASYKIALDLIDSGFDYFAGAGVYDKFDSKDDPKYRGNVFELAGKSGYKVCLKDRAAWAALKPGSKSWSIFDDNAMQFTIDADGSMPTLADLVSKGIEVLDGPKGFFLMCEGGKIDYAAHANDGATAIHDTLAFDDAVKVALAFLERHPDETLVVTTGDHETGGMTLGAVAAAGKFNVELLAGQKISVEKFSNDVKQMILERKGMIGFDEMRPILAERFGLTDFAAAEEKSLREAFLKDIGFVKSRLADTTAHDVRRRYVFAQAVKDVLNVRAGIGWGVYSHTALPTLTTAKGAGADILVGMTENSDIGLRLKKLLAP